jgi:endonuclease/exonuclease/phosphatase (EEP) superfamily protein YafD
MALSESLRRASVAVVEYLGGAIGALTLLSLLGPVWWPLDLAANFRPQYLVLLTLFTVVAAALRKVDVAIALGVMAAINLWFVAPYLWGTVPEAAASAPRVEVMSFNGGISNPARDDVMEYIGDEDPDVVFLFESSFEWEDSARAADLPHRLVAVVPADRLSGITVMVRPDLAPEVIDVPFDAGDAVAVAVGSGSDRLTIIGFHPPSPTTGDRARERDDLLSAAGDWVAGRAEPVLVVGDLNATPFSTAHRALRRAGDLVDSLRGRGLQPTWPVGWGPLMIPIDHALHTEELAVVERRTGPAYESAHRPLFVTITAREARG